MIHVTRLKCTDLILNVKVRPSTARFEYFDLFSYITRIFAINKVALETLLSLSVLPFAIMATTVDKVRTVSLDLRISNANTPATDQGHRGRSMLFPLVTTPGTA